MSRIIKKKNAAQENANALANLINIKRSEDTLISDNIDALEKKEQADKNTDSTTSSEPIVPPQNIPQEKNNQESQIGGEPDNKNIEESQNKNETISEEIPENNQAQEIELEEKNHISKEESESQNKKETINVNTVSNNTPQEFSQNENEGKPENAKGTKEKRKYSGKVAKATGNKKRYTCHVTKEFHEELNNLLTDLAEYTKYKMSYSDWMVNALRNAKEIPYNEMDKYKEEKMVFKAPDQRFSLYTKQTALENGGFAPKSISFIIDSEDFNAALQRAEDNNVVFNQYLVDCMWAQMKYYKKLLQEQNK